MCFDHCQGHDEHDLTTRCAARFPIDHATLICGRPTGHRGLHEGTCADRIRVTSWSTPAYPRVTVPAVDRADDTEPYACDWCGGAWPCSPTRGCRADAIAPPEEESA